MKLLLVEDNLEDADFLAASLRRHNVSDIELSHVTSIKDAVHKLRMQRFDVVLLDLHLPDGSGMECVDAIQATESSVPIVVLDD